MCISGIATPLPDRHPAYTETYGDFGHGQPRMATCAVFCASPFRRHGITFDCYRTKLPVGTGIVHPKQTSGMLAFDQLMAGCTHSAERLKAVVRDSATQSNSHPLRGSLKWKPIKPMNPGTKAIWLAKNHRSSRRISGPFESTCRTNTRSATLVQPGDRQQTAGLRSGKPAGSRRNAWRSDLVPPIRKDRCRLCRARNRAS